MHTTFFMSKTLGGIVSKISGHLRNGRSKLPFTHKRNASDVNLEISVYIGRKRLIACICLFLLAITICLFTGRHYFKLLLINIEKGDIVITFLVFLVLFALVSLPIAWGYVLLNVASGYLYGLLFGALFVSVCALFGIVFAHFALKTFCTNLFIERILKNNTIQSFIKLVENNPRKIVVISRLTPIPFGLQNALFALSNISSGRYLIASVIGLLPTQILNAYIGSTLRSMEDVILHNVNSTTSFLGYLAFAVQMMTTILLLVYVAKKAKHEFNKTMQKESILANPKLRLITA
ncbi:DgyrCDS7249 [Dimorphilus gyrociliatus]|uniref:DgyrCDS7249 n=1 Tax=Dimorphilus gyrociliatus TaxID=2664684 RepID=A0A7I8VS86_9ANNE|nr:DgyrCDS7249 [Dimorphilus gyrociliatus]